MLLRVVATCWKFETGQTLEPTSANISIVSGSSKRGPTMLRSFAQHIQQCCVLLRAFARALILYSSIDNLVRRAFLHRGGGEKPWERGCSISKCPHGAS